MHYQAYPSTTRANRGRCVQRPVPCQGRALGERGRAAPRGSDTSRSEDRTNAPTIVGQGS